MKRVGLVTDDTAKISQQIPIVLKALKIPQFPESQMSIWVLENAQRAKINLQETVFSMYVNNLLSTSVRGVRYYAPPLIDGGIKRCFCLTSDVCRVHRA